MVSVCREEGVGVVGPVLTDGSRTRRRPLLPVALLLGVVAALAPAGVAAPAQAATAGQFVVTMTRTTSVTEGGNSASQATIGETLTYTATASLPAGTSVTDTVVTDVLGARMTLVPGSLCVAGCTLDGAPFTDVTESPANTVRAALPATYAAPAATNGVLVLTFQAKVSDVAANYRGQGLGSTTTVAYTDQDGAAQTRSGTVSTTIVEPSLTAAKTSTGGTVVVPGETKAFTVSTSNASSTNVSTAHDLTVVDTVPAGTEPVTINDGGTWNAATRTITWSLTALAPGATKAFTYTVQVESPAVGGTTYTNTVLATATSLSTATGGVRTPSSSAPTAGDYDATAQRVLTVVLPGVSESVDAPTATIGSNLTWTTGVTVPANTGYFDTTVVSTVPDGLSATGYGTITCTSGCPGTDPAISTFPFTVAGGTQQAAWFVGDLAPAAQQRTYQLVLRGHVLGVRRAGGVVTAPVSFTQQVRIRTNRSDVLPASPAAVPASYADTVGPAAATTAVREPVLAVDTSADRGPTVQGGDLVTYSVAVTNTGGWPAYDVVATSTPDDGLVDVVLVDGSDLSTDGWSAEDPDIRWVVPGPLAAGTTRTLTYTGRVRSGGALRTGDQVTSTATVPSYAGASSADRAASPSNPWRGYTGPQDTVTLTVAAPALTVSVTPDAGAATAGGSTTFSVTVTNADAVATAHSVTARAVLPAGLTLASSSPVGSVTGQSVEWAVGTLAPGASSTYTLVADVGTDVDPGATLTTTATSTADELPAGATDSGSVVVATSADVGVTALAPGATVVAGEEITYTIGTTNAGPSDARGTTLTSTLPPYLAPVALDDTAHCSVAGQVVTCSYGSLAPGADRQVRVTVRVAPSRTAPVVLTTTVTTSTPDGAPANDQTQVTTAVTPVADLGVTTTASSDSVAVGEDLVVTTTTTNDGPSDAQAVVLTDTLPGELTLVGVDDPDRCDVAGQTVTCDYGILAPGEVRRLVVTARATTASTSPVTTTARVASSTHDPDTADDTSAWSTTVTAVTEDPGTAGTFTTGPSATISGTAQVGQVLTAGTGVTAPSAESYRFAWYADGEPVAGATGSTLRLEPAQRGKLVTVLVVATRTGYVDATSRSAPTAPVVTDRAPAVELRVAVPRASGGAATTPDGEQTAVRGRPIVISWSSDAGSRLVANDALATLLSGALGDGPLAASGRVTVRLDRSGTHTFRLTAGNELTTTTAVASLVVVRAPARLGVDAPARAQAGTRTRIHVTGLGARERYYVTVRSGGTTTRIGAGRASGSGEVRARVRIPARLAGHHTVRVRVTGRSTLRTGAVDVRLR